MVENYFGKQLRLYRQKQKDAQIKQTELEAKAAAYDKMKPVFNELKEALEECLALLDKQREEYNNTLTMLPHLQVDRGAIASKSAIALSHAKELEGK